MNDDERTQNLARDRILRLLSDEEIATVSAVETGDCLADGEEYIDLTHLEQGVQRARGETKALGRILPRKVVHERTWSSIIKQINLLDVEAQSSRK